MKQKLNESGLACDSKLLQFVVDYAIDADSDLNTTQIDDWAAYVRLSIDWKNKTISALSDNKNFNTRLRFVITSCLYSIDKSKGKPRKALG